MRSGKSRRALVPSKRAGVIGLKLQQVTGKFISHRAASSCSAFFSCNCIQLLSASTETEKLYYLKNGRLQVFAPHLCNATFRDNIAQEMANQVRTPTR